MRAPLAALALLTSLLAVGCASEVGDGIDEARSSAASIGAGVRSSASSLGAGLRSTCRSSGPQLTTLDGLAGRLAENADQRQQLAPQVRQTVDRLATEIGDRSDLQPVVAAGRDLTEALGNANETAVVLSARQTQVAVRSAQALCKVAG